jgi:hypothetical protein
MNWKDEPATEIQISRLRQLGCLPERPLTKGEAAHLISHHDVTFVKQSNGYSAPAGTSGTYVQFDAYQLRVAVESARRTVFHAEKTETKTEGALGSALEQRQRFWMDTCCEPAQMHMRSKEAMELHMKHGCQYVEPTREQTQEILDALDIALPAWEKEHPELFYQTLELNFPELRKHSLT